MLILGRKKGESIYLPELRIEVRVIDIRSNFVRLGVSAPDGVSILRDDAIETGGFDLEFVREQNSPT